MDKIKFEEVVEGLTDNFEKRLAIDIFNKLAKRYGAEEIPMPTELLEEDPLLIKYKEQFRKAIEELKV